MWIWIAKKASFSSIRGADTSLLTSISSNIILDHVCVWIMSSFQYYPTINLWFKTGVPTLSLWFHSCTCILKCLRIWIPMSLIWKTVSLDSQNLTRLLKFHSNRMTVTVWHFFNQIPHHNSKGNKKIEFSEWILWYGNILCSWSTVFSKFF